MGHGTFLKWTWWHKGLLKIHRATLGTGHQLWAGGLRNGKIGGLKLFACPLQDRVKCLAPHLLESGNFLHPSFNLAKTSSYHIKTTPKLPSPSAWLKTFLPFICIPPPPPILWPPPPPHNWTSPIPFLIINMRHGDPPSTRPLSNLERPGGELTLTNRPPALHPLRAQWTAPLEKSDTRGQQRPWNNRRKWRPDHVTIRGSKRGTWRVSCRLWLKTSE